MEKTGLLITRLLELYNSNAANEQLRITVQLLLSELEKNAKEEQQFESVAVFFPSAYNAVTNGNTIIEATAEIPPPPPLKQEAIATAKPEIKTETPPDINTEANSFDYFNPMVEIPTLALKQQEINETIARQESLNDKLKQASPQKEVGQHLNVGPIKDLRKGIGINDQYLFINELFRGDQTMYDRSIKTINSFNIYGEAELWIKRELKLKLGWSENSHASVLFDQLVRRRFS